MTPLKPCPFCGGTPVYGVAVATTRVSCKVCGISTGWLANISPEVIWNSRTPSWQPIETAPKDGTLILACDPDAGITVSHWHCGPFVPESRVGWYSGDAWADGYGYCRPLTHWMPLPEPPEEK